ncbi:MarR family transcriptional regulator [Gallaecimonas kandeliae]|uniref:MarR family winged helix-turn-helix transcriptional regulator n=1 Tax=Gallaecimonas kandeliae TaxID=3029055 RepID=UPI0026472AE1|nr:MarR family transcriptional regulator [Gallaecimonas kandeliae]WKE64875.1 MarR family transcriptional regulator [Gallaecimonas kandeliae]
MTMDHVDQLLAQWAERRPDLDCSPMGVWGRMSRMAAMASREIERPLKELGLSNTDFDVLATLKRGGQPLTPTELYQSAMLSSGAMTARLDKLEGRGLIHRAPSEEDRRSLKVALTEEGTALIDQAVAIHVENERRLLAPLTEAEQQQLAALMRRWLLARE